MLYLERNREFCSCSQSEICKFQLHENKANAHAGMPFLRYTSVCCIDFLVGLWSYGQRATALFGAWVARVYRVKALQSLDWVNRSEPAPFLYSLKIGVVFSKPNKAKLHRILTDGGCNGKRKGCSKTGNRYSPF